MASHFDCIGISLHSRTDLEEFLERIYDDTRTIPLHSPNQRYRLWSPGGGVNLWIQEDREQGIIGVNPHFAGNGRLLARITELRESEGHPFDGSFYAWCIADASAPSDEGMYPFLVDVSDFQSTQETLQEEQVVTLQIAAFAHELTVYGSEEEYDASQEEEPHFASQFFIPSGLFVNEDARGQERAHAFFSGIVQEVVERTNPETGLSFYALLVETYGGTYDVVSPTNIGPVAKGNIVRGQFWLSGRVVS